jgi:hypothetical protein
MDPHYSPSGGETGQPDDVAHLREQLFNPQWRPFMASLTAELFEAFEADEARGFLRQIGARMATEIPLRKHGDLEELEAGINAALAIMAWGYARLGLVGSEIEIVHRAYPDLNPAHRARTAWRAGFAAVLEGLYTTWLQLQGGRHDMSAKAAPDHIDAPAVTLRFGL